MPRTTDSREDLARIGTFVATMKDAKREILTLQCRIRDGLWSASLLSPGGLIYVSGNGETLALAIRSLDSELTKKARDDREIPF